MTNVLVTLSEMRHYIAGFAALAALLFDKKLGPSDDDLPARWKILLVVPLGFAIFYSEKIDDADKLGILYFDMGLLLLSLLVYMGLWVKFGYVKTFQSPKLWWRFWGGPYVYRDKRVMGGCLTSAARAGLDREKQSGNDVEPQEYFAGVLFNQDRVWTRNSRFLLQALLMVSYFSTAYFLFSTIVIMLKT